ncbi:hypothetical protein N2152v2_006045 [Parachlorella kessleri]
MATSTHMQCSGPRVTASQLQPRTIRSLVMVPPRVHAPRRAPLAPLAASSAPAKSSTNGNGAALAKEDVEVQYLTKRAADVTRHFPSALGVDDFMSRLEIALFQHGFQNDNSIAMVNLCRDEVTHAFKHKIDQVFGSSFSVHGLGGVLSCGLVGMGAGLSHSPVDESSGKERYVFFSFPHIAIDSKGVVGNIARPGRAAMSCACGAIIKSLGDIKRDGLTCSCKPPGVHDPEDVELSVLKQRLARRLEFEGQTDASIEALDLAELTRVAERTITSDLEFLISKAVDTSKADYAVVTGVQIHNWGQEFDNEEPNMEFVAPAKVYAVINGKRTYLDLSKMPALTPRQIRLLASAPDSHYDVSPLAAEEAVCNTAGPSTVREIDPPYMYSSRQSRRNAKQRMQNFTKLL